MSLRPDAESDMSGPGDVTDYDEATEDRATTYDPDPSASLATFYALNGGGSGGGAASGGSTATTTKSPFDADWQFDDGFVCEVNEVSVMVRGYVEYKVVKVKKKGKKKACEVYRDERASNDKVKKLAEKLRKIARWVGDKNKLFAGNQPKFAVRAVFFWPGVADAYRLHGNRGAVRIRTERILNGDEWKSTLAHEMSHGIFESHMPMSGTQRSTSGYALHVGSYYRAFDAMTYTAALPTVGFEQDSTPKITGDQVGIVAVMFSDVLWSGYPDHGHGSALNLDEWHSSALGGWIVNSGLMKKVAKYYAKKLKAPELEKKATELFDLFARLGDEQAIRDLLSPFDEEDVLVDLNNIGETPELRFDNEGTLCEAPDKETQC